ncbi:MAG: barnase inhibitor [Pedosphaera sp.]|nr:barnase inhibitor [Pedosphaera sp.]
MAFFTENDFERLDWRLLQNGSITLYWRTEFLEEDLQWLKGRGYRIDAFDCAKWEDETQLHRAFAESLQFPEYYGHNLDALNDCLSDLEIPESSGRVLIFQRFDMVASKMPYVAGAVLNILAGNARGFLLFGRRLIILIQSDDPKISFGPVGAQPVLWNSREWLNKDRSL